MDDDGVDCHRAKDLTADGLACEILRFRSLWLAAQDDKGLVPVSPSPGTGRLVRSPWIARQPTPGSPDAWLSTAGRSIARRPSCAVGRLAPDARIVTPAYWIVTPE